MVREIVARNKFFQDKNRLGAGLQNLTLEDLLRFMDLRALIVEFIVYMRVSRLITPDFTDERDPETVINIQYDYYSQLLMIKISKLPVGIKNIFKPQLIKNIFEPLLKEMTSPSQQHEEWAIKYCAQFYSHRSWYQMILYQNPFYEVKNKAYEAYYYNNQTHSSNGNAFDPIIQYDELKKMYPLLIEMGITQRYLLLYEIGQLVILIIGFLSWLGVIYHSLEYLLHPMLDEPHLTFVNLIIGSYAAFNATGYSMIYLTERSCFKWDEINLTIQISILQEIEEMMSIGKTPKKKVKNNDITTTSASETPLPCSLSYPPSCVVSDSSSSENKLTKIKESKPRNKRQYETKIPVSITTQLLIVRLTWENPAFESILGIVKNDHEIDFILQPGLSRAWSMKPAVDASCRYHFSIKPMNIYHLQTLSEKKPVK